MRVKKELAEARTNTAINLFRQGLSAREVNERLYEADGFRMNLNNLYALRKSVQEEGNKKKAPKPKKSAPAHVEEEDGWSL